MVCVQLLAVLGAGLAPTEAPEPPGEEEAEGEDATLAGNTEDMLPDLEDAMVELTEAGRAEEEQAAEERRRREGSGGRGSAEAAPGAQLFFFPGEQQSASLLPPPRLPGLVDTLQLPGAESSGDEEDLESFCILEEEEGSGIVPSGGGPGVRLLAPEGIQLVDDHFAVPEAQVDHLRAPKGFPSPQLKLALTRLSLVWQIFGGNDFSESKEMRCNTRAKLEKSGLCLSPDGGPHRKRPAAVPTALNSAMAAADRLKTRGGPGRNHELLIELVVNKMAAQLEVYPWLEEPDCPVSRQILLLPSFEVRDKLVGSEINKLLHPYSCKTRPRQSSASMLHVRCLSVRPDPASSLEEASLRVSLQPFRLNIDQDTLFFIIDFANTLMPAEPSPEVGVGEPGSRTAAPATGQARFQSGMAAIQIEVPEGAEVFEDARSSPPKSPSAEPEREKSATPGTSLSNS
jgi:autophagy-related protein 2